MRVNPAAMNDAASAAVQPVRIQTAAFRGSKPNLCLAIGTNPFDRIIDL
jgi:hypothetical protein